MPRSIILLFCLSCISFELPAQWTLSSTDGLPDLGRSSAVSADYNNDGKLDLALSGINHTGNKEAGIYFNNGNGTYSNSGNAITPVADGDMAVNDFNQDGLIDLLVSGIDANNAKTTQLYKNEGGGIFSTVNVALEGVAYGGIAFADMNNDGKADILLSGLNSLNQPVNVLYQNIGNASFSIKPTAMSGAGYGDLLVLDVNNDSYLDVFISGLNANNQRMLHLYVNRGKNFFVQKNTILPPLRSGGMAAADVNNDGYTDIFVSGSGAGSTNHAAVYTNNAGNGWLLLKSLPAVSDGGGAFGDYNNDGFSDLAVYGFDKTQLITTIFQNVNGTDFSDSGIPLPGASQGSFSWGDENNDQKIDFVISGYNAVPFTSAYKNPASVANALPGTPSHLQYTAYADSIVFLWDAPTDQETVSSGLTYALYIGSSPGAIDIVSPLSNTQTGSRKVAAVGSIQKTSFTFPKLPPGKYYWSVQAIDPSFGASSFATEAIVVSCVQEKISGIETVCMNTALSLQAGTLQDAVTWYSKKSPAVEIGSGKTLSHTLTGRDTVLVKVTKPLGCALYDTLAVDVYPLPQVSVGLDKKSCVNKEVLVTANTVEAQVAWFTEGNGSNILSTQSNYSFVVAEPITLVARVMDLKGCLNYDTLSVSLHPQPIADLGLDRAVCLGKETSFTAGTGTETATWYSQKKGLLLENNFSLVHTVNEADRLWVKVSTIQGCISYDTVDVSLLTLPVANAGEDKIICNAASVVIGDVGAAGLSFSWSPSSSLDDATSSSPLASPSIDTKYTLTVKDVHQCEKTDTVWVYLNKPTVVQAGEDKAICIGEQHVLGGSPTALGSALPYTYRWSPNTGLDEESSANPTAVPVSTTTYSVEVMAGDCLAGTSSVTVTVNPLPSVKAGEDVVVGVGEGATLMASGAQEYQWFPEEFFADDASAQPVVYPNRSRQYWVKGKDINGCYHSDTVKVTVKSELFVPALFTPNEDGVNDVFRAHGFGVEHFALNVYDRWGRLLFESHSLEEGWDGRFNGQAVESGNFTWSVTGTFYDGTAIHFQGQQRGIIKLMR